MTGSSIRVFTTTSTGAHGPSPSEPPVSSGSMTSMCQRGDSRERQAVPWTAHPNCLPNLGLSQYSIGRQGPEANNSAVWRSRCSPAPMLHHM
ncbi:hypothetical protein AAFF_G00017660 [Aldrovandia affinis]|uniref:Uncharacterized protein n=1 Tax=Aldrovandia affinis TaxID=143900 RepID=A0AAD7S5Q9_9TELE|nr:hypothetical protein AAFF_G00017660 [Aldrovandia affinis]